MTHPFPDPATATPGEPAPQPQPLTPAGVEVPPMAAGVLDRASRTLHERYPEVGTLEEVRALLLDSYATLARTSRHPEMLPTTAANLAGQRLRARGIAQGSIESRHPRVLFVCHGNAGRSQMAASLLENRSAGAVTARSAGTSPAGEVLPHALEAMQEIGIPLHNAFPKPVDQDILRAAETVVLFDGAEEQELAVPAGVEVQRWAVPSIRGLSLEQVRGVRDALDLQVRGLIAELGEELVGQPDGPAAQG
ncbi:protein-tyrosine-phosphatase [Micrococcus sp.]|uniref:arsenate-mycothiol transferase ArsC n=1 Tax=Micrococcus sp. TaxID=1271 RepID=UPI002A90FE47|nr:protein-tyrosine-phosphatase [Micrococcus sp.]MDY6054991.1 protein-tyrosine-phosphatase [Micrococcus sp.]